MIKTKISAIILASCMAIVLSGCNSQSTSNKDSATSSEVTTIATTSNSDSVAEVAVDDNVRECLNSVFGALEKGNSEQLIDLYFAKDFLDKAMADENATKSDYIKKIESIHKNYSDTYGDDFKLEYAVTSYGNATADELQKTVDIYKSYGVDISVQKGYKVECRLTFTGSKSKSSIKSSLMIIQVEDKLYCDVSSGFQKQTTSKS